LFVDFDRWKGTWGVTLARVRLIKTISTSIAESFEESGSVLAERRDFGFAGSGRKVDVGLEDVALLTSFEMLEETC
jgi:hypothetical protein